MPPPASASAPRTWGDVPKHLEPMHDTPLLSGKNPPPGHTPRSPPRFQAGWGSPPRSSCFLCPPTITLTLCAGLSTNSPVPLLGRELRRLETVSFMVLNIGSAQ